MLEGGIKFLSCFKVGSCSTPFVPVIKGVFLLYGYVHANIIIFINVSRIYQTIASQSLCFFFLINRKKIKDLFLSKRKPFIDSLIDFKWPFLSPLEINIYYRYIF